MSLYIFEYLSQFAYSIRNKIAHGTDFWASFFANFLIV